MRVPESSRCLTGVFVAALLAGGLAYTASQRQSATFDEITLVSAGVRGVERGRWDLVPDQPPVMMWLYGWATAGADPALPAADTEQAFDDRWDYAQQMFFDFGNDPQALLGRARAVTTIMAVGVVLGAAALAWWIAGPIAGLLAAVLTALLPDLLAHGGVAYNDVPLAFAFLLGVWALDRFVRRPTPMTGGVAGFSMAFAIGIKMSALALLPIAVGLMLAEGWKRRGALPWRRDLVVGVAAAGLVAYVAFVAMYRGDPLLTLFRFNFWRTLMHTAEGHASPAFLLGVTSADGWWFYFPVVFFFKTSIGFQFALVLAAVALTRRWLALSPGGERTAALVEWRGRGALLGVLVFGAFLLRSDLDVGFRHALPILPLLAVLAGVGLVHFVADRRGIAMVVALVAIQAASVLSIHPHYLAYSSVWAGGRDRAWRVLSDSNIDWGQGLLELRRFMEEEGVASVSLSYFGSARPEAYGIEYVALPSFFRLAQNRTPNAEARPRFTVISSTNLHGLYLQGRDPYAPYRGREPYRVLGHALFVYDDGA